MKQNTGIIYESIKGSDAGIFSLFAALFYIYLNTYSLKAKLSDRNMLDGIFYRRIDSLEDLMETVAESDSISSLLKRNSDIRLIVLDSIAFHFRYSLLSSFENTSNNIGKLHRITQVLNEIAYQYNVVVIITNHMTSRPKHSGMITIDMPAILLSIYC